MSIFALIPYIPPAIGLFVLWVVCVLFPLWLFRK